MSSLKDIEVHYVVAGKIDCPGYQQCRRLLQQIASDNRKVRVSAKEMLETEWDDYIENITRVLGSKASSHKRSPIVYYNKNVYVGSKDAVLQHLAENFDLEDTHDSTYYQELAWRELERYFTDSGNKFCYLHFGEKEDREGVQPLKRIVVELFHGTCPRTVENFRALCTGEKKETKDGTKLHYLNTPIHRVVKGGWIQGGDVVDGSGANGASIYGPTFSDESLSLQHSSAGILAMANSGPHSNHSQFYLTLAPLPYLDQKKVVFGRVIKGMETVRRIGESDLRNERPQIGYVVKDCGEVKSAEEIGTC